MSIINTIHQHENNSVTKTPRLTNLFDGALAHAWQLEQLLTAGLCDPAWKGGQRLG
jgi:hypothetical protein